MSSDVAEAVTAMILDRQKAREEAYAKRKRSAAEFRAGHAERRKHGLVARHRAKLARNAQPRSA